MTVPFPASSTPTLRPTVRIALGRYPATAAFRTRGTVGPLAAEFAEVAPISRAFAPMVRDLAFDVSEMALVTFLQAKAYGKPLVMLPVAVAARFQETALLCRANDRTLAGPADLRGRRVGVRAYTQTTGVWLRGILADDHGVEPDMVRWVTFEGAHVAEFADPPWAERAEPGADMLTMLRDGRLDAVIVGNDVPDAPDLRTVFPDPAAAAERFFASHGFVPVNHVVVATRSLASALPEVVEAVLDSLGAASAASQADRVALPFGVPALRPAVELALRYAGEQGLLPRPLGQEEVWAGLPPHLMSDGRAR